MNTDCNSELFFTFFLNYVITTYLRDVYVFFLIFTCRAENDGAPYTDTSHSNSALVVCLVCLINIKNVLSSRAVVAGDGERKHAISIWYAHDDAPQRIKMP